VRALKARNVPVTGLDRMVLTDQPAVQDLMGLADGQSVETVWMPEGDGGETGDGTEAGDSAGNGASREWE